MTIHEAAKRLGLARTAATKYARRLGLRIEKRVTAINGYRCYSITEEDLKAIAAERRRSQHAHSEKKSRNLQRIAREYRAVAKAKRDPEERLRSLAKAVTAAADRRRRLREWRARHDVQAYDYDIRRAVTKKTGRIHPWREAEQINMARWRENHED